MPDKQIEIRNAKPRQLLRTSKFDTNKQLKIGVTSHALSTEDAVEKSLTQGQLAVNVILNAIYIGHHFDSFPRGEAGEFYWHTVVSDGKNILLTDSKSAGFGGLDGIQSSVSSGTWLDIEDLNIFNTDQRDRNSRSLSVGVRVIESDDDDTALAVFRDLGAGAAAAIAGFTGNQDLGIAADQVVKIVLGLISLDGDDLALSGVRGFHSYEKYNIGNFFRMKGEEGTSAILSVIPIDRSEDEFFYREKIVRIISGNNIDNETSTFYIPSEGKISFFFKASNFSVRISLIDEKTNKEVRSVFSKGIRSFLVHTFDNIKPGEYKLRVTPTFGKKGKLQYCYTADNIR